MAIKISYDGQKPMYEQIKDAIKQSVYKGEYKNNDLLPSVRQLAKDLNISMITTKRAYTDLEQEGFIYTILGKGTFVKAHDISAIMENRKSELLEKFEKTTKQMHTENIEKLKLDEIIEKTYGGIGNE